MATEPGPAGPSRPSPSEGAAAGGADAAAARASTAGTVPPELAREAEASLRIEHWRDGEHRTMAGLDALRHAVGESTARHWVDLVDPSPDLVAAVATELGLHPLIAEDIVERNQRPKLELTDGFAHLVVFAVAWERELLVEEIDIVLGSRFLLTVHTRYWDPRRAEHLRDGVAAVLGRGTDYLLWAILDHVVDAYYPVFDRIEDVIDDLEDRIVSRPGRDTLDQLFSLKRQLVDLRHVSSPQREVFNQLTNRALPFVAPEHVVYFRDVYDHAVHLSDEYDSFRELVTAALDVYLSTVNNNLSLIMKRLTGITVILAGIGAFAGIFGMSEAGAAFALGEAPGFWIVTIGIVALAVLIAVVLRRSEWI
ncbi:MAG: magnesium transporter CorA family protein [Chloroflexi bacterium]|nr:magnesium transporter CorA family protein [Chloroflexota bacterium]